MALSEAALSAIISGAAAVGSSAIGAGSAALANRKSFKWSKKFFDYQNEYNQTHYSPAQNMALLQQAGINPHEVAGTPGSGMSMQGNMSVPQYQSPLDGAKESVLQAMQYGLNLYAQKRSIDNQSDLVQSQIAKNTADAAKTNYQVAHILPFESEFAKNRQKIPLYQLGTLKLQQQKMLNEISLFSMQKQKYQLALDLMELEKEYAGEYYRYRNQKVKHDASIAGSEAGIRSLDFTNYRDFGLRPQDPYYVRMGANVVSSLENPSNNSFWSRLYKNIFK